MPLVLTSTPFTASARYLWSGARGGPGLTVRYFRARVTLTEVAPSILASVTADGRYRLWVNGEPLGRGPAKGTLAHYHVETYELAPHLRPGMNVLAAEVRWYGENAPGSEVHSPDPGFLFHCPALGLGANPGPWRTWADESVTPDTTAYIDNAQAFLNHTDRCDLRRMPRGWRGADFDDGAWPPAVTLGPVTNRGGTWGVSDLRCLHPRDIPALLEEPRRLTGHRRARDDGSPFLPGDGCPCHVPAGQSATLLLDAGALTTGYPVLRFTGGADREVRVLYAEALGRWTRLNGRRVWEKRVRDDPAGTPHGYRDTLILAGDDEWEPFHWRAFRFLLIEVLPGEAPLAIESIHYRFCTFPQTRLARFESSDPQAAAFWETSWRTLQLCSHEIYDDTPYYEQFSYIADTRLEALQSLYLANDARLPRRTLRMFLDTLRPDGLIDSRMPCATRQTIPYFCLIWIQMVEDYWDWVGAEDRDLVRRCLVAVDAILAHFRARLREDGFVGRTGPWNMVDHAPGWIRGEPPAVVAGGSTYLTALYAEALAVGARLHREAGHPEDAPRWESLAARTREALRRLAWNAGLGLFDEAPGSTHPRSVHVQAAVVNAGAASAEQAAALRSALTDPRDLHPPRFMQAFYHARALERLGAYGAFHRRVLEPWRAMLAENATAWWEYPNPTRSDCHAWSAWIAVDFLRTVLGARPGAPGWRRIDLRPQFDGLDWAQGALATPAGRIGVAWKRLAEGVHFEAVTPSGIPATLHLPDGSVHEFPGGGAIVRLHRVS